jgi:hypothetical protein
MMAHRKKRMQAPMMMQIDNPRQQESATMALTFSKLLGKCSRIHKGCLDRFGCAFVKG